MKIQTDKDFALSVNPPTHHLQAHIITSFSRFSHTQMGYDPAFTLPLVNPSQKLAVNALDTGAAITFPQLEKHAAETFIIGCEIFCRGFLCSRGMQNWLVKHSTNYKSLF